MHFNAHSALVDRHALLSPSKYHWINYDDEKFDITFRSALAAKRGTELHELAAHCIRLKVKLSASKKTLNMFVNDAIGHRMEPEVILAYSENAFGTADAVSFRGGILRIHDLKTGITKTSMHQLEIYAALFCLEYDVRPAEIKIELRIYQNDEVMIYEPDLDDIMLIMDKIITFDRRIDLMKLEAQE